MKRIAQILYDKAHYIFEADEVPDWPPYPDGTKPLLIDITDKPHVQEGWDYDAETNTFSEPVIPDPGPQPELEPILDQEDVALQTLLNTELLVILAELDM